MALQCILAMRRREKIAELDPEENNDADYVQLPNGILPNEDGVNQLKDEQHGATKQIYAIMEWWRCTDGKNTDTGMPRFKAFPV